MKICQCHEKILGQKKTPRYTQKKISQNQFPKVLQQANEIPNSPKNQNEILPKQQKKTTQESKQWDQEHSITQNPMCEAQYAKSYEDMSNYEENPIQEA